MSWKKITTFALSILFAFTVATSLANVTFTADVREPQTSSSSVETSSEGETVVIEGHIVCLIPDPSRIMIEAVVANGSPSEFSPRYALITREGRVYEIEDNWEVICALQTSPGKVKIEGSVADNPSGRFPLFTFKGFK